MGEKVFWRELKRRHVYRVAAAYAVTGWLLVQISTQVFPVFHLPDWSEQAVVLLILAGFPIALILAWAFDVVPSGIVRADVGAAPGLRWRMRRAGAALGLIGVAIALIAGGAWWQFGRRGAPPANRPVAARSSPTLAQRAPSAVRAGYIPAKSIAVLPFAHLSSDPNNAYFSDGITEEILDALAQVPGLKVAARTSAFRFKSGRSDVREVGKMLGVATALEGSVQTSGGEVRITVRLVDTRSGYQLWSEKCDRRLLGIFAIEDEISGAIAARLRVQWNDARRQVAHGARDPRAHDFYLRGMALVAARGAGLLEAVADFRQAVAIDPRFSPAWGALAEAEMLLPYYFLEPTNKAFPKGEAAARQALAIDPDSAQAEVALAMMYRVQWRWREADEALRRALRVAPGDAEVADQHAQFLHDVGQSQAALAEIDRAQGLDPLSGVIGVVRAITLTSLHRFDGAAREAGRVTATHPGLALGHFVAADVAIYRHDYRTARAQLSLGARLVGEEPATYLRLVDGIEMPARRAAARSALRTAGGGNEWLNTPARIKWLLLLGDRNGALAKLQHMDKELMFGLNDVWQPAFDPARDDPRYAAALKRMGLPYRPAEAPVPASAVTGSAP